MNKMSNKQIVIPAALRGRYENKNKTVQKLEIKYDEISNAITTVQKDTIIIICKSEVNSKFER